MSSKRNNRLSGEMKKTITNIIRKQLKDPRISDMSSITEVKVTEDLRYAKVFVSVYGNQEIVNSTIEALDNAKGYIRKELGKYLKIRYTPELLFERDNSIEHGIRINKLIEKVIEEEKGYSNKWCKNIFW